MKRKTIVTVMILTLAAGVAGAQDDAMGLYFSETEFTIDTAQAVVSPGFTTAAYIVLTNPTMAVATGYEVNISSSASDFAIPVTSLSFDTNLGTNTNQIVTFSIPKPTAPGGTVLATVFIATASTNYEEIAFGPSIPSSLPAGVPVIYDGAGGLVAGSPPFDASAVAWLNGVPVPDEGVSWGDVRALFR